jgi:putative ABC transport system substrate-binding protein
MAISIGRRQFISALGGATVALPLTARAQQPEQMRRIGVLMNVAADDPEGPNRFAVFQQALQQLGWSEGRNVRIDIRFGANDVERDRTYASELVAPAPDVILAGGTLGVSALQRVTHTIPIVFVGVTDPVGAGLVDSLARPGVQAASAAGSL